MDRTVAHLNIEHYRRLLALETDESKRKMLQKLLAEEEAKLAKIRQEAAGKQKR
jgi:HPt (histidine-containing phosphotransfer) domain-containing protein